MPVWVTRHVRIPNINRWIGTHTGRPGKQVREPAAGEKQAGHLFPVTVTACQNAGWCVPSKEITHSPHSAPTLLCRGVCRGLGTVLIGSLFVSCFLKRGFLFLALGGSLQLTFCLAEISFSLKLSCPSHFSPPYPLQRIRPSKEWTPQAIGSHMFPGSC